MDLEVVEPGEGGPVPTGERFRSTYRIEDGEREVVEELTPIDP